MSERRIRVLFWSIPAVTSAEAQTGGFHVRQDGQNVAAGSGPMDAVRREAAHYAAVYRQDGPVTVRVWKHKRREAGL